MYIFGYWQHVRYWDGTIVRVNLIESSVYIKLLSTDVHDIYKKKNFQKMQEILKPLNGKLHIAFYDDKETLLFENEKPERPLGNILQESRVSVGSDTIFIKIARYLRPSWNTAYFKWLLTHDKWFSSELDRITIPAIFFFFIWSLFLSTLIWRRKANLENDRLFHVLKEFDNPQNEK